MTSPKTGGHAFPVVAPPEAAVTAGMTLRDWFAGQALAGYVVKGMSVEKVVDKAYDAADLMLEARAKGGER